MKVKDVIYIDAYSVSIFARYECDKIPGHMSMQYSAINLMLSFNVTSDLHSVAHVYLMSFLPSKCELLALSL